MCQYLRPLEWTEYQNLLVADQSKPLLGSKVRNERASVSIRKAGLLIDRDDLLDRFLCGDRTLEMRRILLELS